MACRFGGERPWCRCAGSDTRRAAPYDRGAKFRCRQCLGLTYCTQQENRGDRLVLKAKWLAVRLGGDGRGLELPDKPAGMHWRTYDRLTSQFVVAYVAGLESWQEELGRLAGALGKRGR